MTKEHEKMKQPSEPRKENKSNNHLVIAVFVAIIVIIFVLFSLGAQPSPSKNPSTTVKPTMIGSTTSTGQVTVTASATVNVEESWSQINNPGVERACLAQAKREAKAMGYSESLVFGCSCTETASAEVKSYDCKVSALDGNHPVSVVCTKSKQVCEVTSEQGKVTYTFEQLQAFR